MRDFIDTETRERIRRNVGRLARPVDYPGPPPGAARYGILFDGRDLTGAGPGGGAGDGGPIANPIPTVPQGSIIGVALSTANGNRRVGVTTPLPYPSVIRAITVHGSGAVNAAVSFRVMLAQDDDTTAVADPTGVDLIEFAGDLIGAEDRGVHAALSTSQLVVEPWRKLLASGYRIKLKVSNQSGGTNVTAVYVDVDDLEFH